MDVFEMINDPVRNEQWESISCDALMNIFPLSLIEEDMNVAPWDTNVECAEVGTVDTERENLIM